MDRYSGALSELREGTPTHAALAEAGTPLAGQKGRAAVVLISDGLPTDEIGRPVAADLSLQAAKEVAAGHAGKLCFHTVQIGADPAATNPLKSLS
jgi:Mg-chelatase subunit ChlD